MTEDNSKQPQFFQFWTVQNCRGCEEIWRDRNCVTFRDMYGEQRTVNWRHIIKIDDDKGGKINGN